MAIYKGDKKVIALYKGDKKIIKRYKGTQVLYNYIPEDTGTTTYAEDALAFEFTGTSLTYKLNNKTYTATTSPTIVNLSDLGLDANTYFMFDNLFYNQQNLTKVLHFPKVTGTNLIGYSIFRSCKNVEYIDLSNLGILKSLHLLFNDCTSLKNLILDDVDLSGYNYLNNNSAFINVPNDIQISMNGCNCESIVTIKQALNDSGIVTYNNNVVTNNNCTFEPSETIEYNVDFYDIDERETYDKELKANSIYMIVTNYNEDGVSSYTENDISEEVSYEYEQIEEGLENKIKCTIYYKGNNIYEKTYRGTLPNTEPDPEPEPEPDTNACTLSCDTDKTIPMQKFYINWYEGIEGVRGSEKYITFSQTPNGTGDCYNCVTSGNNILNICLSENSYRKPGFLIPTSGKISDLPMENGYYVLDMGKTVYFKCAEENALFDHVFYCNPNDNGGDDVSDCDGSTLSFTFTGTKVTFVENAYTSSSGKTSISYNNTGVIDNGDGSYSYSTEKTLSGSMRTMFYSSATTMTEISCFPDTSNVDNMMMMFQDCSGLTYINTESFNTSKVTDMKNMFYNCQSLKEIDISGFDTTNVTNMYTMFGGCSSLTSIKTGEFDLQKCSNLYGMFFGCNSLIDLDLSGWKLASNTDLSNFVNQCVNLKTLNVTGWNISKISKYAYFLKDCTSLNRLILGSVSQSTYDWWYARLTQFSLQNQVTIEYTIV